MTSFMTAIAGLGPFIVGVGNVLTSLSHGQMPNSTDLALISTGIMGFLAKDFNVTGGTKAQ